MLLQDHPYNATTLWQSHREFLQRQRALASYHYADITIEAWPDVYHPSDDSSTLFVLRHLPQWRGERILELGCGSGLLGLVLSKHNKVSMGDIDALAVECAKHNARINEIDIDIHQSDLFAAFKGKRFDCILFNVPYWHRAAENPVENMACDAEGETFKRFAKELPNYLNPKACAVFTYSNLSNQTLLAQMRASKQFNINLLAEEVDKKTGVIRWLWSCQLR